MATIKTMYVAADGTSFETEQACNEHEAMLAVWADAKAYIVHAGLAKAQAGLLRKHLVEFVKFRELARGQDELPNSQD